MSVADASEEIAKNLVMKVKELLFSTSLSKQDWQMIRAIKAALKERDERAAKIAETYYSSGGRYIAEKIRNEDSNAN